MSPITPTRLLLHDVNSDNEYLSNVNLRRALGLGFDKQAMIDAIFQNGNLAMTSFAAPAVMASATSFQEALNAKGDDLYPANGDVEGQGLPEDRP